MRYGRALRRLLMAGLFALLAVAPGILLPGTAKAGGPALAQDGFAIDQFYDELAPFGEWVNHPSHGYVWLPRAVAPDWRPYTVGNWVDTEEYGWYWDSNEPFAWAVYHYGRWSFDPAYGWYWVPGDTWAPAWVQWRYGDEYVGWAPEAPIATGGYVYGGPARYAPPPPQDSWVFVQPRYLASPAVRNYAVPRTSISIAFIRSTNVYRPAYRNGYVYNYGMPRDRWSRLTHQRLEPRRIYRGYSRGRPQNWNGRGRRDLYVYAPGVKRGVGPRRPPKKVSHRPSKANAARAARAKANTIRTRPGVTIPSYRGQGLRAPERRPLAQGGGLVPRAGGPSAKSKAASKPKTAARPKPSPANASIAKANAAKAKAARTNAAKAQAARAKANTIRTRPGVTIPNYRGQGLRAPERRPLAQGGGLAPRAGGPSAKSKAASKPRTAARPKPSPAKASIAKANAAKVNAAKAKAARANATKAQAARARAAKANATRAQAARARASRASAAKIQAARVRAAKANAAKAFNGKPRTATISHGVPDGLRGKSGGGKPGAGKGGGAKKHGGGNRPPACKTNPNLPICGRRG